MEPVTKEHLRSDMGVSDVASVSSGTVESSQISSSRASSPVYEQPYQGNEVEEEDPLIRRATGNRALKVVASSDDEDDNEAEETQADRDSLDEEMEAMFDEESEQEDEVDADEDYAHYEDDELESESSEEDEEPVRQINRSSGRRASRGRDELDLSSVDPSLYGLRRSGRASRQPVSYNFEQGGDDYEEDDYERPAKRSSSSPRRKKKIGRRGDMDDFIVDDDHEESDEEPSDSEDDAWGLSSRRTKRNARSSRKRKIENDAPLYGEIRFSSRQKKVKSYNVDDLFDSDVFEDGLKDDTWVKKSSSKQSIATSVTTLADGEDGIDMVLDYRLLDAVKESYPKGIETLSAAKDDCEFHVKWRNYSHRHNTWELYSFLSTFKGVKRLDNFIRQTDQINATLVDPEDLEQHEINREMKRELFAQYRKVERVIASREAPIPEDELDDHTDPDSYGNGMRTEYYCKWKGLSYHHCTWESVQEIAEEHQREIDSFLDRIQSTQLPHKNASYGPKSAPTRPPFQKLAKQPSYLVGGTLRDYQLEGLNWLGYSWSKNNNVILADEMGLGKTIQSVSFLSYMFHSRNVYGPYLVVVPLSTIDAWQREFEKWSPDMNVIVYLGNAASRVIMQEHEFYVQGTKRIKFNALITTYEMILKDQHILRAVRWSNLLVDEAHRLKNSSSQLHDVLKEFSTAHRLLITGTPLQNTVGELWALLNFLMPEKFSDLSEFENNYSSIEQTAQIQALHEALKPHLLRRMKKDVEKSLPNKTERILRVELSPMQKQYYKWILTKNFRELNKGGKQSSLLNIMTELKKAANHPYLFPNAETPSSDPNVVLAGLIQNSGKMQLLDKLLNRLFQDGHRVLIFSQMVRILDVLTDYLDLKRYRYQRLDGAMAAENRRNAIDQFNAPGSNDFCFLLSTRAGGLGINLTAADTVIIFDSDYNPQNDLQAMARAHRIGQKKTVNIYRFVSSSTIEEDIIERAKRKMVLDHLIIQRMDTSGNTVLGGKSNSSQNGKFDKKELNEIIQFGAKALFAENADSSGASGGKKTMGDIDLDDILARAEHHDTESGLDGGKNQEFLGQFNVADFGSTALNWDDIIPEEERIKADLEEQAKMDELLFVPRRRTAVVSYADPSERARIPNASSEDPTKKNAKRKRAASGAGKQKKMISNLEDLSSAPKEKFIRAIVRAVLKFGDIERRFEDMCSELDCLDQIFDNTLVRDVCQRLVEICQGAVREKKEKKKEEKEEDMKDFVAPKAPSKASQVISVTFEGVTNINAATIVSRVNDMSILNRVMKDKWSEKLLQFRFTNPLKPVSKWTCSWGQRDDAMLTVGVFKHGYGHWDAIRADPTLELSRKIFVSGANQSDGSGDVTNDLATPSNRPKRNLIPKATHLTRRVDYLLKVLEEQERKPRRKHSSTQSIKKRSSLSSGSLNKNMKQTKLSFAPSSSRESPSKKAKPKRPSKESSPAGPSKAQRVNEGQNSDAESSFGNMSSFKRLCKPVRLELSELEVIRSKSSQAEVVKSTTRLLRIIGDHINHVLEGTPNSKKDTTSRGLWKYVASHFPPNTSSKHVRRLYERLKGDVKEKKAKSALEMIEESESKSRGKTNLSEQPKKANPSERKHMTPEKKSNVGVSKHSPTKLEPEPPIKHTPVKHLTPKSKSQTPVPFTEKKSPERTSITPRKLFENGSTQSSLTRSDSRPDSVTNSPNQHTPLRESSYSPAKEVGNTGFRLPMKKRFGKMDTPPKKDRY